MYSKPLTDESYREYDYGDRVYRIDNPVSLFVGKTTHRVFDGAVVHCIPFPVVGTRTVVLRWAPKHLDNPVQF